MNNNEIQKELSRLTKRYADVGATEEKVLELVEATKLPCWASVCRWASISTGRKFSPSMMSAAWSHDRKRKSLHT